MSAVSETDCIERSIVIKATRSRVWQALSEAEKFGAWFGAKLDGQVFAPGKQVIGPNTACGHDGVMFDIIVDRIEPQDLFSFRWHPYAVDPSMDYSAEERTLVTFTLKDAPDNGTVVTVVESGFDNVSPQRRLEAFPMHSKGWEVQLKNVERYVTA